MSDRKQLAQDMGYGRVGQFFAAVPPIGTPGLVLPAVVGLTTLKDQNQKQ